MCKKCNYFHSKKDYLGCAIEKKGHYEGKNASGMKELPLNEGGP